MTETVKTLHQRLAAAMTRVDYVQKEKKAGMSYSIVSHDAVTAKVRPILLEEGVIYYPIALDAVQNGNRTEVLMRVRFVNVDDASDVIDVPSLGYGIDNQDKGPGKAISYAVKYALLKALGLETGDDPDTDQDATHKPAAPAQRPAEPPYDPDTGEIKEAYGTPVAWKMGAMDKLGFTKPAKELDGHERRMVNQEYTAMLVERAGKFKAHKGALVYVNQFEQTHSAYIDALDPDLRQIVVSALAEARDRATNKAHDPADFRDVGLPPDPMPEEYLRG